MRADAGASEGRLVAPSSQPIPTAPPPHSPIDGKRTVLYGGAPPTTCATLARRRSSCSPRRYHGAEQGRLRHARLVARPGVQQGCPRDVERSIPDPRIFAVIHRLRPAVTGGPGRVSQPSVASPIICRSALAIEAHRGVASLANTLGIGCAMRLALRSDRQAHPPPTARGRDNNPTQKNLTY